MDDAQDAAVAQQEAQRDEDEERPESQGSGSSGSSNASGSVAGSPALKPEGRSILLEQIHDLRAQQANLKEQKAKLAKDMKNAVKKKKRLQSAASLLSDLDLVEVLRMRKARRGDDGGQALEVEEAEKDGN